MYQFFKQLYFFLPLKKPFFSFVKLFWQPSNRLAGYLKFKCRFTIKVSGAPLTIFNNNSSVSSIVFWKGINGLEKETMNLWLRLAKNSNQILDVGANNGLFGLAAKAVNPSASIHFFEPLSRNVEQVKKNLQLNSFSAEVNECAVSVSNGTATFYDMESEENTIASFDPEHVTMHQHHKKLLPIEVKTISLNTYVKEHSIPKVDLIKIDVEGAEKQVIEGAMEILKNHTPNLIIEILNATALEEITVIIERANNSYSRYCIDEMKGIVEINKGDSASNRNYFFTTSKKPPTKMLRALN